MWLSNKSLPILCASFSKVDSLILLAQGSESPSFKTKARFLSHALEISKKTSNIKGEYAIIKRVTAAVAVDGKYVAKKEGEKKVITYQPRSQKEIQAITALVQQTIGYYSIRKDMVTVSNFEFRQNDDKLISILDEIRSGKVSEASYEIFRLRYKKELADDFNPTKLYTHNIDVDRVNDQELDKINEIPYTFKERHDTFPNRFKHIT